MESPVEIFEARIVYPCPWKDCGKILSNKDSLKRHCRIHTGDKPFICSLCLSEGKDVRFSQSTNLNNHLTTHANLRPYKCPEEGCDKAFRRKNALGVHLRLHKDEWPFVCPHEGCQKPFRQSSNLYTHLRTKHPL